jgi:hypothetical protein
MNSAVALGVLLVHPHDALRQRLAEFAALVVELDEDRHLVLAAEVGLGAAVVPVLPGQAVFLAHRHGGGGEQRHLLGLVVERSRSAG